MKCLLSVCRGIAVAGKLRGAKQGGGGIYAQFFVKLSHKSCFRGFAELNFRLGIPINPAIGLPSGRCASNTRPSRSISATALTNSIFMPARLVVAAATNDKFRSRH
ncbi:MAG: hypothetical protein CM15mP46_6320 [Alphaproteobacteria bacterium]|nr:MAG: hypothetical protein CM15mP46_6320 [Alphaproteobacteria bacterium]